jgi:tRNA (cmo5U34)-methyltransferase
MKQAMMRNLKNTYRPKRSSKQASNRDNEIQKEENELKRKGTKKECTSDNSTPHPASKYDSQIRNTIPYYDDFHAETIHFIKATGMHPRLWLDTGCGTGSLVDQAFNIFKETTFILVDPSPEMMNEAKNKLQKKKRDVERIRFLEPVSTESLTLKSKVDVITAIQSHHYLSKAKREKATRTCYSLLKDKGLYITFENIRPSSEKGIENAKKYWSDYQRSRGKDAEAVRNHMKRFDSEYFPITIEEHLKLLKSCGFRTVELFWYSYMQAGFYCIK